MPQPLSKVRPIRQSVWMANSISHRPELANMVMEAIASWSLTELYLGETLSHFLGADPHIGLAMYLSISSAEARRAALDGAARAALSDDDLALFNRVLKAIKPVRDRRNDFAHGCWGYSSELPNALLWADAKDMIVHDARLMKPRKGDKPIVVPASGLPESTMVYRAADLKGDLSDAHHAHNCAFLLLSGLSFGGATRDRTLKELSRSPLLRRLDVPNPPTLP